MRILNGLFIALCGAAASEQVLADCVWEDAGVGLTTPKAAYTVTVPPKLTYKKVKIGGVLASFSKNYPDMAQLKCKKHSVVEVKLDIKGLAPAGLPYVYKTGIEGVGIRIATGRNVYPPKQHVSGGTRVFINSVPSVIDVEYIRTGMAVGSGRVTTDFTVEHTAPGVTPSLVTYRPSTTVTELVNSIYFNGCESRTKIMNVPMGKELYGRIKSNTTTKKAFAFDVRCNGQPSKPLPVKIYFEGDSPADGQLTLSGAGQKGVASGVNMVLTTSEGVNLPFNKKANAIPLEWQRSEGQGEIYRFSGLAHYALTKGEFKPGRADATMTYTLDYN